MADEVRPGLKSFEQFVIEESTRCQCKACYNYLVVHDYMMYDMTGVTPQWKLDQIQRKAYNTWLKECPRFPPRKHHKGNGVPKGIWAGTLTVSPQDPYNEEDMIIAIRKIFKQETCPVEKYAWYLEYTENGLPHIHFVYRTPDGGRIHAKVFKRIWKIWNENQACGAGHRGGYHRLCADEDAYLKYIAKDKGRHDTNWTTD